MPVDPRLNCAAEICCPPPAAREAKESLVKELIRSLELSITVDGEPIDGLVEYDLDFTSIIVDRMAELDIEFAPGELMRAIRNLADHPNSKVKEKGGNISPEEAEGFDLNSAE